MSFSYPADGGLKPQARPYADTLAVKDVLLAEAERIRKQQQHPAHDQGAFKTLTGMRASVFVVDDLAHPETPEDREIVKAWVDYVDAKPEPTVAFNGEATKITGLKIEYDPDRMFGVQPDFDPHVPEHVCVTGTMTAYFQDTKLLDQLQASEAAWIKALERDWYGPTWKREVMWAIHNLIAHPLSEITHWLGYLHPSIRDFGLHFHDITVPRHAPNTGRG